MKVKYFSDTDTAYIEFSNQEVADKISNILVWIKTENLWG